MPSIDITTKTVTRLQKYAIPLVDTFDSVISKLLDAYETKPKGVVGHSTHSTIQVFDPAAAPNLAHTTVKSIKFCGVHFRPADTYWNSLMHSAIREAAKRVASPEALQAHVLANSLVGQKENDGYKYLSDVGLSVQGQDANGAWRTIYHLASTFNLPVEVTFVWQDKPKAFAPNVTGSFTV